MKRLATQKGSTFDGRVSQTAAEREIEMVLLIVDDSGYVVRVEGPDKLQTLKSWLLAREEDEAMDAEDVLAQAEEANAMDLVG